MFNSRFLSIQILKLQAQKIATDKPELKEIIDQFCDSLYMDDLVISKDNTEDTINFLQKITDFLKKCGMKPHKIMSNNTEVQQAWPESLKKDPENACVLGTKWNYETDSLSIQEPSFKDNELKNPTKNSFKMSREHFFF